MEGNSDENVLNDTGPAAAAKDGGHPRNRWRCMQPRVCNYCWKTFSNSFNLKQHIVNVHVQSQGVACTLCEKIVKNKWYLRKHLVTAHGAPLKRVKTADGGITVPADKQPDNAQEDTKPAAPPPQQQPAPAPGLILNQNPNIAALTNSLSKNFVLPLFSYDPATAALVGVMSGAQAVIPGQTAGGLAAVPMAANEQPKDTAADEDDEELVVDN